METPSSITLLKPRLRLLRRSPSPRLQDNGMDSTPHAGPSSARTHFTNFVDDEDEQPTPRMPPKIITSSNGDQGSSPVTHTPIATPLPADTPAARLRALLAREPRSPRNVVSTAPQAPPSETHSDTDAPRSVSSTSSIARESLKDLFSRALREPGDTPQKRRPRRNSVDTSEVEITPMLDRERAKHKGKRRSLSDEEVERPKSTKESDSFRSSQAATFDTLRTRLMSSQSQLIEQNVPTAIYDQSDSPVMPINHPDPHVHDNSALPRQFSLSPGTPPAATSTPQHSFQLPSQLYHRSNLLEQDSEMQRAMGDVLNSENEASSSVRNFDQSKFAQPRSRSSLSFRGNPQGHETRSRHASHEFEPSQTTSISISRVDGKEQDRSREEGRNHQRERDWNRPRTHSRSGTPDLRHHHSQEFRSPSHVKSISHESVVLRGGSPRPRYGLERRGSLASLRSFDDDRSSRPSSMSSQADYRDRMSELERERHHEREREWNKRHPPSRPSSSLSTSSSHSHGHSHPPRPPSATPYLTPTLASLQRQSSRSSLRSNSPTSSLVSRVSSGEREDDEQREAAHERERNWNSPHPKWSASKRHSYGNDKEGTPSSDILHKSHNSSNGNRSLRASSSLPSLTPPTDQQNNFLSLRGDTSFTHSTSRLHNVPSQSDSSHVENVSNSSPRRSAAAASRFGWHFSRSQKLPPLELESPSNGHARRQEDSLRRTRENASPTPSSQPSIRASGAVKSSSIPVRSVPKSPAKSRGAGNLQVAEDDGVSFKKGHHRGLTELSESAGRVSPQPAEDPWEQEDMVLASDEESIHDFLQPQSTTPKTEPRDFTPEEVVTDAETEVLASPPPSPSRPRRSISSPSSELPTQREFDSSAPTRTLEPIPFLSASPPVLMTSSTPPGSPPSGIPSLDGQPTLLTTPPRQTALSGSILNFRTPSPPHELPGPPLSSDDERLGTEGTPIKSSGTVAFNPNYTAMKTPRPPGAWAVTPVQDKMDSRSPSPPPTDLTPTSPSGSVPLSRANSYPETQPTAEDTLRNGLVTPTTSISRVNSLPLRTPAPPGAWMATPNPASTQNGAGDQSQFGSIGRRRSILKVRFDVTESEGSAVEAPHDDSPVSAIRLTNPELPITRPAGSSGEQGKANAGVVVNGATSSAVVSVPPRPVTPERPSTPVSRDNAPSPRSLRKSPSVRVVDAYGRERVEASQGTVPQPQNGHADAGRKTYGSLQSAPSSTPRSTSRSMVRIVDAMGRDVDDMPEPRTDMSFDGNASIVSDDTPLGHAAALTRMRQTLRDLADGLSDADRSAEDLALDSTHLEELEEVSKAARLVRNQLAQNLQIESIKELDMRRNHKSGKSPAWTSRILPDAISNGERPWSRAIMYWGIIVQLILVIAMWRYAHVEARRLFYTTYYDPLYPELHPIQGGSYFMGTLSLSRPWSIHDSYDTIRREGWMALHKELLRALRHAGDRLWETWGELPSTGMEKPT